ncbi:YqeG family HAD IIIA-type phosphatase [Desulfofalx alkaliphila]|uniref:YqeG family HAD IIIA-type phosphatase n=1 Tax=Desulfofalx alkaliphila TaxID=105483 RepID=UPI000A582BF6|nr:YqeG family HAD IIIA-type phosphatase [Desulfofalx alkaliphila]
MRIFYPDMYVSALQNIDIEQLKQRGIKALIFDLDNTIIPWGSNDMPDETVAWFANLKEQGFKVCIVSNNSKDRVAQMAGILQIQAIHKAAKPLRRAFLRAVQMMDVRPEETAMVGDQIFTDVLGANRLGLYTILVMPINKREFIGTRINRQLEKLVLRRIRHQLIK